jgi:phosphatidylglycerol:prolipoprotein diacylglycerol transferase
MSYPYLSDVWEAAVGRPPPFPLPIPIFGLFVGLAMLVAADLLRRELIRLHADGRIGMARGRDGPMPPQAIVPDLVLLTLIAGIVGSRIAHLLEHLDPFVAHPWEMIATRAGFSIFGGLILGTIAGAIWVRRHGLPILPVCDAIAPGMMLGYGVGRIGCQVSGDGDWGIAADLGLKPDAWPTWLWAQTYPHNIAGVNIPLPGVYPTPIYETAACVIGFILLWTLRRHAYRDGWLFALYMLLSGIERLLIEQIRVNPVFSIGPLRATQAEMISVALIIAGGIGVAVLGRRAGATGAASSRRRNSATARPGSQDRR